MRVIDVARALPTSASDDDDDLAFGKGRLVRVWLRWLSDTVRLSALLLFQSLTTALTQHMPVYLGALSISLDQLMGKNLCYSLFFS